MASGRNDVRRGGKNRPTLSYEEINDSIIEALRDASPKPGDQARRTRARMRDNAPTPNPHPEIASRAPSSSPKPKRRSSAPSASPKPERRSSAPSTSPKPRARPAASPGVSAANESAMERKAEPTPKDVTFKRSREERIRRMERRAGNDR